MRRAIVVSLLALFLMGARHRVVEPPRTLDIHRSIIVTDFHIVDSIVNNVDTLGMQRVFQSLIDRAGVRMTSNQLFQQMFDTQNPKPGLTVANAPHCDDFMTDGMPSFNGFPRRCPTEEGQRLATDFPFATSGFQQFIALAAVNRFDRAPQDGANCGEYRLIYARLNLLPNDMLHIIFEGVLPNPHPELGLAACRPVAQFWADLSSVDSPDEINQRLQHFFFDGIDGFEPVVAPDHFGVNGGDIRAVELSASARHIPRFYSFRLVTDCSAGPCRLVIQPDVLDNTVYGPLFNGANDSDVAKAFRSDFIQQIASLTQPTVNFTDHIPRQYLVGESDNSDATPPSFLAYENFQEGLNTPGGQQFRDAINAELARLGNPVTLQELLRRVDTQNCNGCHNGNVSIGAGLTFPNGTGVQVFEEFEGPRWLISPAVRDVFAPARARALVNYLETGQLPEHSN